ncbi:hypothetical protein MKUB_27180 [Mycobacterium kubicae]|uniref:Uncharacterized protein n=1 Tax=Mycobacterium kubicae TaxID=120959 RepID=A0ABQ1BNF2_9MYCO|nr:hypothetical protein MKUB_27180 [Mycobacterium kubicae]
MWTMSWPPISGSGTSIGECCFPAHSGTGRADGGNNLAGVGVRSHDLTDSVVADAYHHARGGRRAAADPVTKTAPHTDGVRGAVFVSAAIT